MGEHFAEEMGLLELRKKEEDVLGYINVSTGISRSSKIRAITKSTIRATMPMALALSHLQSKKYFIRAIQMNITIKPATKPTMKIPSKSARTVPRIEIHRAPVNFALSFPASHLPAIHSTGESMIMSIMTCITRPIRKRPDSTP